MEKEEIIVDTPVEFNGLRIIPVVQVATHCYSKKKRVSAFCSKKPLFVIIIRESDIKAFDMDGSSVDIDELTGSVPGLREVL